MKRVYEPVVNCGLNAGMNPMCWDGKPFDTEEACEDWIANNMSNLSLNEMGGCVFPMEVEIDDD